MADFESGLAARLLQMQRAPNSGVHSWEQCYTYFERADSDFNEDEAALRLAFYLASWGMYRGSAKLRNFGYVALLPVVDEIRKEHWKNLRGISISTAIERAAEIFNFLGELKSTIKRVLPEVTPTSTLLTKIGLGSLACVPAYDRFVVLGIKQNKDWLARPNVKSFREMLEHLSNDNSFKKFQSILVGENLKMQSGAEFPEMRLVDAYLNYLGDLTASI